MLIRQAEKRKKNATHDIRPNDFIEILSSGIQKSIT
jgi:hypothetical protein